MRFIELNRLVERLLPTRAVSNQGHEPEFAIARQLPEAFAALKQETQQVYLVPASLIPQKEPSLEELRQVFHDIFPLLTEREGEYWWNDLVGDATSSSLRAPRPSEKEVLLYGVDLLRPARYHHVRDFCHFFNLVPANYLELFGLVRHLGAAMGPRPHLALGSFVEWDQDGHRNFPCARINQKGEKAFTAKRDGEFGADIRFILRPLSGLPSE